VTHAGLCFLLVVRNALAIYVNYSLVASSLTPSIIFTSLHSTLPILQPSPNLSNHSTFCCLEAFTTRSSPQNVLSSRRTLFSMPMPILQACYRPVSRSWPAWTHSTREDVLVGYACSSHGSHRPQYVYNAGVLPDSGYESGTFSLASLR
jgi:hypothetical protein